MEWINIISNKDARISKIDKITICYFRDNMLEWGNKENKF